MTPKFIIPICFGYKEAVKLTWKGILPLIIHITKEELRKETDIIIEPVCQETLLNFFGVYYKLQHIKYNKYMYYLVKVDNDSIYKTLIISEKEK